MSERYEIKNAAPMTLEPLLRAWVRSHAAAFRTTFPARWVNNIYLDGPGRHALAANLGGLSERGKLRLRWYGETLSLVGGGVLEWKHKRGEVGSKVRHALPFDIDLAETWPAIVRRLAGPASGPLLPVVLQHPEPVLVNRYRREYFVSSDGLVRLTIDTRLTAFDQTLSARPQLRHPAPGEPLVVVELKADTGATSRLTEIAGSLPWRRVAFSKYVRGYLS